MGVFDRLKPKPTTKDNSGSKPIQEVKIPVYKIAGLRDLGSNNVIVKKLDEAQAADESAYRAAKMIDALLTYSGTVNRQHIGLGAFIEVEILGQDDEVLLLKVTRVRQ